MFAQLLNVSNGGESGEARKTIYSSPLSATAPERPPPCNVAHSILGQPLRWCGSSAEGRDGHLRSDNLVN
jgi:hypothetical protein